MKHKCQIVDGLRYEGGALMEAAANEIELNRTHIAELEAQRDECRESLSSWSNGAGARIQELEAENERLRNLIKLMQSAVQNYLPPDPQYADKDWMEGE